MATRARLQRHGWEGDLVVDAWEPPAPLEDRVLIEVEACGVCYRDLVDRDGGFAFMQLPITPGHEAVGRVVAVGPAVRDWQIGDRVGTLQRDFCGACTACREGAESSCSRAMAAFGLTIDGGYASHLIAPERALYRVPDPIAAPAAAVMQCTYGTVLSALRTTSPEARVLVTGANGGVGSAAIQLAARRGAHVTAVVRDASHREYLESIGAADVLTADGTAFHKQLAQRADIAIDCVGPPTFNASLRSLRPGGRLVVVGNVVQRRVELNLGYVVTRNVQIHGSAGATRAVMAELFELHRQQPFDIAVEPLPLAEAEHAQRRLRAGGIRGRLALVP